MAPPELSTPVVAVVVQELNPAVVVQGAQAAQV